MKYTVLTILIASWLAGLTAPAAELSMVKVIAQRVNLRAKPDAQAEVVGQVDEGEFLLVKSYHNEWAQLLPPENIDLWVHNEFLAEDTVTASTLNVRAGAGINYSVVGELAKGDKVQVRGHFGEWVRIAPPSSCSLWVNRDLVTPYQLEAGATAAAEPAAPREPEARAAPEEKRTRKPGSTTRPSAAVPAPAGDAPAGMDRPPPADLDLIPLEGQGKVVQKEGVLKQAGMAFGRPAPFRLMHEDQGSLAVICYVRGNREQLTSFLNQRMTIRGRQYWVQGQRYPVIIPDQIIPHLQP